jgi:3-dehydroquinate dehydratase-2
LPRVLDIRQRLRGQITLAVAPASAPQRILSGECWMKILVIHGAGMNMRGKVQVEVFGPMTLPQYDERIQSYARDLGVAIINPAGYTSGHPALCAAIAQVRFPTIELHVSNPARRGASSDVARVTRGSIAGFGVFGYYLAMKALQDLNNST